MQREQMPQDGNGLMLYVDISPSAADRNCGLEKKRVEFADWDCLRRYSDSQKVGERNENREQEIGDDDDVSNGRWTKPLRSLDLNTLNREATQPLSSSKVVAVERRCSKSLKRPALSQEKVGGDFKENKGAESELISKRKGIKRKTFAALQRVVEEMPLIEKPFSCRVSQENREVEIHGRSHVSGAKPDAKPDEFEGKIFLDLEVEGFAPVSTRADESSIDVSAVDHLSQAHRFLRTITARSLPSQENVAKEAMDEVNGYAARSNFGSAQLSEAQLPHLALSFWPSYSGVTETGPQDFSSQIRCRRASTALEKFMSSKTSSKGVNAQTFRRPLKRGKKILNPHKNSRVYMQDNPRIGICPWAFNFTEPSDLIGRFKPGIMNKVRDSKQVSAILGAILRSATESNLCRNNKSESLEAKMNKAVDAMDDDDCHSTEALLETHTSSCSENINALGQVDESTTTLAQAKTDAKATFRWDSKNDESTYDVNSGRGDNEQHQKEAWGACSDNDSPSRPGKLPYSLPSTCKTASDIFANDRKMGERSKCRCNDEKTQEGSRGQRSDVTKLIDLNKDIPRSVDADYGKENHDIEECFGEGQQPVAFPNMSCSGSAAAADVASQWLDLLGLDIKGRLSALKRSRRRVRNIIVSGQLDSASGDLFQSHAPQVPGACPTHSTSTPSNFRGETLTEQGDFIGELEHELRMDRWRSLFISMDAVLCMEGEKLETWLKNVQKMQAHCFGVTTKRLQPGQLPLFNTWMPTGTAANQSCYGQPSNTIFSATMAMQQELAQTASAASIASTANFAKRMQGPMKTVAV